MTERHLTQKLKDAIDKEMPNAVVFKHADAFTSGIPDLSITWFGITSWVEIKYANPKIIQKQVQKMNMLALQCSIHDLALYVIYDAQRGATFICDPSLIDTYWEGMCIDGFAHKTVAQLIKERHTVRHIAMSKGLREHTHPTGRKE